jgi:ubiquitin-conjugating enzyme E2 N
MFVNSCNIQAFLNAPNLDDPLAKNIVKHWKSDEVEDVVTRLYLN